MNTQLRQTDTRSPLLAKKRYANIAPLTFSSHSIAKEGQVNEDTILIDRRRGLAGVFDGVGGVDAGEVASQMAAQVIRRVWKRIVQQQHPDQNARLLMLHDDLDVQSLVHQLLEQTQAAISDEGERRVKAAKKRGEEVGCPETTAVVSVLCQRLDQKGYVIGYAHVGDSRIYLLRPGESLQRLTVDDGYATKKVHEQAITEEDALRIDQTTHAEQLTEAEREIFDKRYGITQSLGHLHERKTSITIHTGQTMAYPGDRVLLCSDGIHDNLTDAEIEAILRRSARTTVAHRLVQRALARSGETHLRAKKDDMSAIIITCNN